MAVGVAMLPLLAGVMSPLPADDARPTSSAPQAKITNPHGPLATPCQNCHTYTSWKPIRSNPEFNHDQTGYPLRGMHRKVGCTQCHTSLIFKNVSKTCADCHADIHRRQFGANCESCHTVKGWNVSLDAIRNHQNRFPLVGAHALVECDQCHKGAASGQFQGLSTDCYSCHQKDFLTPVIDHVGLGFSTTCTSCHTMDSWVNAKFDHLKYTGYALTGMHATLPCTACHINNVFKGTPASCFACHSNDFLHSNNPSHVQLGLPHECGDCHSTTNWLNAKFDHTLYAHYPLTGKHAAVTCAQCHVNNNYNSTPTACYACHKADFNGTKSPNHVSGGFPTDCSMCHTTGGWSPSSFNHSKFPLTGAHATVQCLQCHTNNNFTTLPTTCYGCHQKDFTATTNPNHVAVGFPTSCTTCHSTTNWTPVAFDHAVYAHYPLTGAHAKLACAQCHTNNNYTSTSAACYGCHQKDWNGTNSPPHAIVGFPTSCETCHSTAAWTGATFNHNTTKFPLTGAHVKVTCAQCHVNNNYTTLPTACYGCHRKDFTGTTKPAHVASGFPTDCTLCHSTANWTSSTFDHNSVFPLTGKHATTPCAQCHTNNNYKSLPTTCYGCHQKDYTGTNAPPHATVGFPTTCANCHSTTDWTGTSFDHNTTKFPLTGAHVKVPCAQCHVNNNYTTLPTACYGCHQKDFTGTTKPAHVASGFPTDCTLCHSTANWTSSTFDHNSVFPLTGKHATTPCAQCHTNNNYKTLPTTCYGCHQKDYTGTNAPPHSTVGFPTTCATCHSTTDWTGASFNHNTTKFPLTGAHIKVPCAQCHTNNNYTTLPTSCYGCHQKDYAGTNNPPHATVGFPTTCATCHNTASWTAASFNHNNTAFPLTGAHVKVTCAQCHVNNNYTTLPTACYGCHQKDFTGTKNPPHAAEGFPTDCTLCHSTSNWTSSTFNHNSVFPLTGKHATIQCAQCHTNNNYKTLPTTCYGCHQKDYAGTKAPPHATVGFPTTCSDCHSTTDWTGASFDHNTTKFPLTGAHVKVPCTQCHTNNNYTTLPTACYGCHQKDFTGTTNPAHVTAGFPTDCTLCHSTSNWTSSTFNHASVFPLTGKHASTPCAQCHTNNNYTTLPTTCYGCHKKDYDGTNAPPHVTVGFPTTCSNCHSTTDWTGASFDHNTTSFPLTGAHVKVPCAQCHTNNNYTTLPTACYGCHQKDFTGTTNPAHVAEGFPTNCTLCHSTSNWTSSTFNHNSVFPLTGAHAKLQCAQCHTNNNYTTLPTTCYGCHQKDYAGTNAPPHATVGFPTTCSNCHSTTDWTGASFDHNTTKFPLTGAHVKVPCAQCHTNNNYTTLPTACYGCHQKDFTGTTNPAHVAAGFPTDCTLCHSTTNWTSSTFNHASVFPLTGAHASLQCAQCHTNNNYKTLPTTCYGCHKKDFTGTTNPNHVTVAFPTTCDTCHSTSNWTPVTFNHTVYAHYALTGGHATVACAQCHTSNNYTSTPTACYSCHKADYDGTTNPNHVASGFPTDCSICHSTSNWTSSTFNHNNTAFPLTGAHTTVACAKCHVNNNYTTLPTACYGCHAADWNGTTDPNHKAAGFPTTCNTCHTTTAWTGASFNHNNTPFPLTGAHVKVDCVKCHINNVFAGTPTACYSCHQKDFTGTTNPNHVSAGWPTTCTICHNTTAWLPANLPASYHTFFPLNHGNANGVCANCHTNSSNYSVFQCTVCHTAAQTNPEHDGVSGYVYNSVNCYACHKNGGGD
jgi:hypothetical protein